MFSKIKEKLKNFFKSIKEEEKKEKGKEKIREVRKKEKKKKGKKEKVKERKIIFFRKKISEEKFEDLWEKLELILLENNVSLHVVKAIKEEMKEKLVGKEADDIEEKIKEELKEAIKKIIEDSPDFIEKIKEIIKNKKICKIVFFGINGSGKTTTIAKIANLLKKNKLSCVFAASDTFRAASIEQLQKHAKNLDVKVISSEYGVDPASVAYDAIKYAESKNVNVVLIDTAGRMHTEKNLMREMEKICRVVNPDLKIFVGESIAGNDLIEQVKTFNESVGIDGIILTKADVDDKGGACISVSYITKKPIFFIGIGQGYGDIEKFEKKKILKNLGL